MSRRRLRLSIRTRLTALYGGLFLLAGILLLGLNVVFFQHSLNFTKQHLLQAARINPAIRQSLSKLDNGGDSQERALQKSDRGTAEHQLIESSLEALAIMVILAGGLGWLAASRSLRPVKAITAAAKAASEHNLDERVALDGPDDELKELADTFDNLMGRLDAAFASQRRFVANASHELRTPLTVMRTAIDVTLAKPDRTPAQLEEMATKVRAASQRSERLIEALLVLARSDRGIDSRDPVDLGVLADEALQLFADQAQAAGITIQTSLQPAQTCGDSALLERTVENLVENAIRHNIPGGRVHITTATTDQKAALTISNTGPQIDDDDIPRLFEPFQRKRPVRTGSDRGVGVGLSIVASVAAAHHGHVSAEPRPGGGLDITLTLPPPVEGSPTVARAADLPADRIQNGHEVLASTKAAPSQSTTCSP
jgi:signal transduction histidine kinase